MPVVRTLRVRVDWVQFPAPRFWCGTRVRAQSRSSAQGGYYLDGLGSIPGTEGNA